MTLNQAIDHVKVSLRQEPKDLDTFQLANILPPGKEIYLYGGGDMGHIVYAEMQRLDIPVAGYIDRSGNTQLLPVPFYTLNQMGRKENVAVLICYVSNCYDETVSALKAVGIDAILIPINFFAQKMIYADELRKNDKTIRDMEDEIMEALLRLEDDESRDVFCGILRAYITKDFEKEIICRKHSSLHPEAIGGGGGKASNMTD